MDRHRVDVGPFCPEAFPTEEALQELTRITRAVHETVPRRFYEGVLIPSTDGNLLSLYLRSVEYVKYIGEAGRLISIIALRIRERRIASSFFGWRDKEILSNEHA